MRSILSSSRRYGRRFRNRRRACRRDEGNRQCLTEEVITFKMSSAGPSYRFGQENGLTENQSHYKHSLSVGHSPR